MRNFDINKEQKKYEHLILNFYFVVTILVFQ